MFGGALLDGVWGGPILVKQGLFRSKVRGVGRPLRRLCREHRNLARGPGFPAEAAEISALRRRWPTPPPVAPSARRVGRLPDESSAVEVLGLDDEAKLTRDVVRRARDERGALDLERHHHRLVETL